MVVVVVIVSVMIQSCVLCSHRQQPFLSCRLHQCLTSVKFCQPSIRQFPHQQHQQPVLG